MIIIILTKILLSLLVMKHFPTLDHFIEADQFFRTISPLSKDLFMLQGSFGFSRPFAELTILLSVTEWLVASEQANELLRSHVYATRIRIPSTETTRGYLFY